MKHFLFYHLLFLIAQPALSQPSKDTQQLKEVIIQGQKPLFQQRPDGTVVNVQSSLLARGSSVLQVLERSPGVVIDGRNNSIVLNGKTGVMVMIDGKLLRMPVEQVVSLLNSMPADNIATIELLTTPGASYEAEGNAGLINIVTRKSRRPGTSGSVSVTGGYGWGEKATAGINLSRNAGKFRWHGSYTYSRDRTYSDFDIISAQNMPVFGGKMETTYRDTTERLQDNHGASVGIDAGLDSGTTVGAGVSYNDSHAAFHTETYATYMLPPDSILHFQGDIQRKNQWTHLVSSVYLEKKFKKDQVLHIDADHIYFDTRQPSEIRSILLDKNGKPANNDNDVFASRQRGTAATTIYSQVMKTDYSTRLSKQIKLETGLKAAATRASGSSTIERMEGNEWVGREETNTSLVMREIIGAGYASVSTMLDSSNDLVIGIRYEYSNTNLKEALTAERSTARRLGVLFPNIFFTHRLDPVSALQFSYSKRISRPSYNDLASYAAYSDPTAVYTGNPYLRPTVTHNLKLGYNYRRNSFSLLFSHDKNSIARYQITESPSKDLLYISPLNIPWQRALQLQAAVPVRANAWWAMQYHFTAGPRQFRLGHTKVPVQYTYFGYSANVTHSFSLPKKYSLEISGWYNSLSYNGSVKTGGFGSFNAGMKKELRNHAGSFQLSVSDIFRTVRIHNYYGTLAAEAFDIRNHVIYSGESTRSPIFKVSFSTAFGRKLSSLKKPGGTSDENERIRRE